MRTDCYLQPGDTNLRCLVYQNRLTTHIYLHSCLPHNDFVISYRLTRDDWLCALYSVAYKLGLAHILSEDTVVKILTNNGALPQLDLGLT